MCGLIRSATELGQAARPLERSDLADQGPVRGRIDRRRQKQQPELFTESVDPLLAPVGEEVDTDGWYLQTGYLFKIGLEIAGLYSTILPEGPQNDIREYGLAFNYYFSKHNHRLQVDFLDLTFQGPDASPRIDARVVRVQLQFEL